ncbi:chymotrypsin BII-like [Tigriopus californicus]|uniref:chymotrypsin BII-like n=1 Tax=Tigriopus californicus TaxID=6832 RepID=UPI0027D9F4CE|nr:chymotrypsin BII-like [Tigriopus californicus]
MVLGTEAKPHSWPYIVSLNVDDNHICAGSILNEEWILTAAHCLDGAVSVEVTAGAHNQADFTESTQVRITSTDLTVNRDYDDVNIISDTGLIRLPEKLDLSGPNIKAVVMASADPLANEIVTSVGWGLTEDFGTVSATLNQVDVPVLDYDECLAAWDNILDPKQLCINAEGGKGTCGGDSGGPTMFNNQQVGITSFGGSSCGSGEPAGLVSVAQYKDWICANTEGLDDC